MTLTDEQKTRILNACYQLTHCNGYKESEGHLWVAAPVYTILDILGADADSIFDEPVNDPMDDVNYVGHRMHY